MPSSPWTELSNHVLFTEIRAEMTKLCSDNRMPLSIQDFGPPLVHAKRDFSPGVNWIKLLQNKTFSTVFDATTQQMIVSMIVFILLCPHKAACKKEQPCSFLMHVPTSKLTHHHVIHKLADNRWRPSFLQYLCIFVDPKWTCTVTTKSFTRCQ